MKIYQLYGKVQCDYTLGKTQKSFTLTIHNILSFHSHTIELEKMRWKKGHNIKRTSAFLQTRFLHSLISIFFFRKIDLRYYFIPYFFYQSNRQFNNLFVSKLINLVWKFSKISNKFYFLINLFFHIESSLAIFRMCSDSSYIDLLTNQINICFK